MAAELHIDMVDFDWPKRTDDAPGFMARRRGAESRHLQGQHDQQSHAGGGGPAEWQRAPEAAYDQWLSFGGCTQIRYAADLMLGQPHQSGVDSAEQDMTYSGFNEALRQVILHGQPTDRPAVEATARHARELLDAVATAPVINLELHRGVQCYTGDPASEQLLGARPGDTFDVGLFSTTPDPDTAGRFAEATGFGIARSSAGSYDTLVPVVIRFPDGVRGVASRPELDLDGWPEDPATGRPAEPTVPFEVVTGGRFRVVDVEVTNPVVGSRTITVEQLGVWDPDTAELRSARYQSGGPGWFRLFDGVQGQPRVVDGRSVVRLLAELRHPGHPDQKVHAGGRRVAEAELADVAQEAGGFSYDTLRDRLIRHGIAVALSGHSGRMSMSRFRQPGEAQRFVADTLTAWRAAGITTRRVGGWHDTEHDEMVLDPIDIVHGRAAGVELGRARGEQAVFDLDRGEVIDTGGTGGRDDSAVLRGVAWPHGERRGSRTAEGSCGDDRRGDRGGCGCGRCAAARGDERRVLRLVVELRAREFRHPNHSTGTDQSVHAGGRGGGTIDVLAGGASRGPEGAKVKIKTRVTGPNGERLVMSVAALTTGDLRVDPPGGRPKDRNAEQLDAAVDDTVAGLIGPENVEGHGRSSFGQNVDDVLDSALARYEADPALIQADRFYEGFHDATSVVADAVARIPAGTGPAVTMEGVVAATAVMSPAVEATMNLRYAAELAVSIRRNPRISSMGSTDDEVAADEASARATGTNRMVAHLEGRLSQLLASKPKTLKRSDVQQEIKELQFSIDGIRAGSVQRLSDLPSIAAAHLLHASRKLRGPSVGDPPDGVRPDLWGAPGEPGAGFGVGKSWNGVESAVSLLRGYNVDIPALESAPAGGPRRWSNQYGEGIVGQRSPVTPDTGINDVKLRSFYNNIMDPTGRYSGADVTVDFHAENTAMMTLGSNSSGKGLPVGADGTRQGKSISGINSSPSVYTVPVGVRAHVADIMRDPARKARIAAVTGEDPATMPASRVQEIVWAEWKRVLAENPIPPPSQPAPGKTNKVKIRLANGKTRELVDYRNPKEDDVDEEAADE